MWSQLLTGLLTIFVLAKLGTVVALPAFAQNPVQNNAQMNAIVGTWQCGKSYTEFNSYGQRTSGFTEQWVMRLNPDASFQANGMQSGIGGNWGFQGQGRWQTGPHRGQTAVVLDGMRTDPTMGQAPFIVGVYLGPQGQTLYNQVDVPQPNGNGIQARTNVQCQRTQG